ncbi:carboxypeptidase-like regulatory domain-containing protein [Natronococcus roseus]|uniref:carboxypeptidase-like regulatory domain-containing protein n=1 Tax=Natronococcus roseus TaxID=1052014 RepID=UPI00374D0DDF
MERRTFIAGVSVGTGSVLAGCTEDDGSEDDTADETDGTANNGESESDEEPADGGTESSEDEADDGTDGDIDDDEEAGDEDEDSQEADGEEADGEATDGEDGDDEGTDDEDSEETDDEDTDGSDAEEPPTAEITIRVTDTADEPVSGAEIDGEGEPHEADIPLEFDTETDEDGVASTPIYENEYTITVDHPDYDSATVEHVHDGETELTVELEAEGYETEIVNETPLEVSEFETYDGYGVRGCRVGVPISREDADEGYLQFDYRFTAYDGADVVAETASPQSIDADSSRDLSAQFEDLDPCTEATRITLELWNAQEVDHEDGAVDGEITTTPEAEGVFVVEDHEFDESECRVSADTVNDSDEQITGLIEIVMYGAGVTDVDGAQTESSSFDVDLEPGEERSFNAGSRICAELESYELRLDVE